MNYITCIDEQIIIISAVMFSFAVGAIITAMGFLALWAFERLLSLT